MGSKTAVVWKTVLLRVCTCTSSPYTPTYPAPLPLQALLSSPRRLRWRRPSWRPGASHPHLLLVTHRSPSPSPTSSKKDMNTTWRWWFLEDCPCPLSSHKIRCCPCLRTRVVVCPLKGAEGGMPGLYH